MEYALPSVGVARFFLRPRPFICLLLFLIVSFAPPARTQQPAVEVEVSGADHWKDTGIKVEAGDTLVITASGSIQYLDSQPAGPEGVPRGWKDLLRSFPVARGNRGALIGRIGDSSAAQPFLIGERTEMNAGAAGQLFLGINQMSTESAKGSFQVRIEIRKAAAGPKAPSAEERVVAREVEQIAGVTPELLAQYPRRVQDAEGTPGDITNFVLIGSEDTVRDALKKAGWVSVDRTKKDALLRGLVTSLSKQGYVELPMSELMLFGRAQDYGYAHAEPLVVVARRHHFRIWKAPFTVDGQTVWVGAGTHDIGFDRDQRTGGITHKIDPNVDEEREFIRGSLVQTGMVSEVSYVAPASAVKSAKTAHGEAFQSDGRVLVMRMVGDRRDRSQRFAQMFCSVLASYPDAQQWGACSQFIQSGTGGSEALPPISNKYRVLIVPGVMNTCAQSTPAYQEGQAYLREKYGLTVDLLAVPNESAESNAHLIGQWLRDQSAQDPRKFIVLGYSKGAPDVQTALALEPDAASHVAAFVTVAGAVGGSPIAEVMPAIADRWLSSLNFGSCRGNLAEAFQSLRRDVRQTFLRRYPTPVVPTYSLAATAEENNVSKILKQTWQLMSAYDRQQDGQLTKGDALVPGAVYLGTLLGDHFAVALPLANVNDASVRSFVDRNRYPRTALLEAVVRFVVGDLEAQQGQSKEVAEPKPVAEVANVRFYSDPLLNLHHVLYAAAWARRPDHTHILAGELPGPLDAPMTVEERAKWDAAVDYYDKHIASRDLLRTRGMEELHAALVAGNLESDAVGPELRAVLESALPIYLRYFWPEHDRANRAWIATANDRLSQIAPEVIPRLEELYGVKWFASPVRADVVWVANAEGAYTTNGPPPHAIISTETIDWATAEIVFHEFSHVLVVPLDGRLASALGDRVRDHRRLWHAIQFYLTGAAVQEALKAKGIMYTPFSEDLFNRAWPQYREVVETNWGPYVQGKISMDEAIAGTVKMLDSVK